MDRVRDLGVSLPKGVAPTLHRFTEYFQGFEGVGIIRELFGDKTVEVLSNLKVEFFSARWGYMSTSDVDGHILMSTHHIEHSDFKTVYLDVVHELCHVKQFFDGRTLYDDRYSYVDSPVEVEAYKKTVEEARRIGLSEQEIAEYLRVEWTSEEDYKRLLTTLGVSKGTGGSE